MHAIVQRRYGSPDLLELDELDRPVPGEGQVLVRVEAAAVNIGDWHLVTGLPYVVRMVAGLPRPRHAVPGLNMAGRVAAIGPGVRELREGDEVFGWGNGAFAEYACADEAHLLRKPDRLTFAQAAAVGDSAMTAVDAVRDQARVRAGDRVLVNGASGGVGTFAVQVAKALGAHVTAVCSTRNVDLVRALGADEVIDYTRGDFLGNGHRYDAMLDMVGNRSLADCRRALMRDGTYVLVGVAQTGRWIGLGRQAHALATSAFVPQTIRVFVSTPRRDRLSFVAELVEAGKVAPVLDREYALADVPAAVRYVGEGHARGKVVVRT
jgi:NADPH:quinone reductase-like Zn-dependent oxidoreductase